MPLSATHTRTMPGSSSRPLIFTCGRTPAATYFRALPMRFSRTWSRSTRSPWTGGIDPTVTKSAASRPRAIRFAASARSSRSRLNARLRLVAWASRCRISPCIRADDARTRLMNSCTTCGLSSPSAAASSSSSVQPSMAASGLRRSWATTPANAASSWRCACSWVASRISSTARARSCCVSRGSGAADTESTRPSCPAGWKATWALRTVSPANARRLGRSRSGSRCPSANRSGRSSRWRGGSDGSKPSATDAAGFTIRISPASSTTASPSAIELMTVSSTPAW